MPEDCPFTKDFPHRSNLSDSLGVYGLFPDSPDYHLNGFFASHLVVRAGSTVFQVNGMSLKQRILIEPMAVTVHALERAKTTGLMNFASTVVVQGCGPIGLMMIATLYAYGISDIIAVDAVPQRLEFAKKMGAATTLNVKELGTRERSLRFAEPPRAGAQISPSSAPACQRLPRRSGNSSAGAVACARSGSSWTTVNARSTRTRISAKKRSRPWFMGLHRAGIPHRHRDDPSSGDHRIPVEDLVTHTFPLAEINQAMATNIALEGIKIAVVRNRSFPIHSSVYRLGRRSGDGCGTRSRRVRRGRREHRGRCQARNRAGSMVGSFIMTGAGVGDSAPAGLGGTGAGPQAVSSAAVPIMVASIFMVYGNRS